MANFNPENPGIWFFFNPDDESEGGVCLRELSIDENDKITRITVRTKKKFRRGTAYDDVQIDEKLARKMQFDYCILDWKNVQLGGQDLECNSENKVKVMEATDFVKFVADCISELTETNRSLEEARAKNLGSSSDGTSTSPTAKTA